GPYEPLRVEPRALPARWTVAPFPLQNDEPRRRARLGVSICAQAQRLRVSVRAHETRARRGAPEPRGPAAPRTGNRLAHPPGAGSTPRGRFEGPPFPPPPLSIVPLVCAACAIVILAASLVLRPPLHGETKVWLLLGLGVLPITAAMTGNVQGYETTKKRSFCG